MITLIAAGMLRDCRQYYTGLVPRHEICHAPGTILRKDCKGVGNILTPSHVASLRREIRYNHGYQCALADFGEHVAVRRVRKETASRLCHEAADYSRSPQ